MWWRVIVISSLAMLRPPAPAGGEALRARWSDGPRFTSADGELELHVSGRLQVDWTWGLATSSALVDAFGELEDDAEIRRARLGVEGVLRQRWEWKVEYDFAFDGGEPKDVYVGVRDTPAGDVRVGHVKEPLGLEVLTSSRFLPFVERSLPSVLVPERNLGVLFQGHRGHRFNWGAGAFRESDGFDLEPDGGLNLTGRAAWRPVWGRAGRRLVHLGLGATVKETAALGDAFPPAEIHLARPGIEIGALDADGEELVDLELALVAGPVWASGELLRAEVEVADRSTLSLAGGYLQAGWFFTGEHRSFRTESGVFGRIRPRRPLGSGGAGAWELAARWSRLDLGDAPLGAVVEGLTLGLNWYPRDLIRVMLDWVHPEVAGRGSAEALLVRAQVDF